MICAACFVGTLMLILLDLSVVDPVKKSTGCNVLYIIIFIAIIIIIIHYYYYCYYYYYHYKFLITQ